jgi:tRNA A-37 threonylcarbamoyl transferase component Bud32
MAGEPQRAPRRDETPPSIPGYELSGFIGRGSSGAVYRARQLAVDREVAIKILHPHLASESRVVRCLQREARTTARLAHPHIVSAVDMGETDGRWWYAMELVDGPSLAQRLRSEGRIRERDALRLFIPLCEALEHLWEHGVVHRDIKPGNILIDKAGGARLADLGLAVAEDDPSITGTGGTLGTPHYISPEQAVDPRKADVKSDLWSFGATLFHAVCGRPPFAGESAAEVLSGVLYSRIPDPEELEPALSSRLSLVLRKCLTRDPARRYQNPHELLLDLERVRERRAPKIQRSRLDPVQRKGDQARRVALAAGAGVVVVLGVLAVLLPPLLRGERAADPLTAPDGGPFEPLAELKARREASLARPAELLSELQEMGPRVPLRERVDYEELLRSVDADLRRAVRGLRTEIETQIDATIHDGDLEAGWRVMDEIEPRFARTAGYGFDGLASVGVNLHAWRDRLSLNLGVATDTAVSELEALLLDWRGARLAEVDDAIAQQDWGRALSALALPPAKDLYEQAGFKLRLPASSPAGILEHLADEFLQRAERLESDWQRLDRELREFVVTRRATLERQLREGPPRIAAEELLRSAFERELFDRHLSLEKLPPERIVVGRGRPLLFGRSGFEELEASARALAALEASLLEDDLRADQAEVEELAGSALRRRDYARALTLWEEARERLTAATRIEDSPVRAELARRAEVRIAEARALDGLLDLVSEHVRALDGQAIELRWGSILYPSVRIEARGDPRQEGFRAERIAGVLSLTGLPSQQFETFAALGSETELTPEERLVLASFRWHEGRPQDAQHVLLFSGPLPEGELDRALGADLAARINEALEQSAQRNPAREAEAKRLLNDVFDAEFRRRTPLKAQARVTRLLEDLADVPAVKSQSAELLKIRASLEESAPQDAEREFQRVFAPSTLELEPFARVRLGYDFSEGRTGAWDRGDWVADGLGLVLGPRSAVQGWDQLAAERGVRLVLRTPLVPDNFELRLRFEALKGETPARLLWVTAGGFQVALSAADLPGSTGGARHLVGTEDGKLFLQRLLDGEGKRTESLLVPGTPPRELWFKGQRRSGRCQLFLDGLELESTAGLRAPPSDARALQIRSWGSVRVLSVTIEGAR